MKQALLLNIIFSLLLITGCVRDKVHFIGIDGSSGTVSECSGNETKDCFRPLGDDECFIKDPIPNPKPKNWKQTYHAGPCKK